MVKIKTVFFNAGGTLLQLKNNNLPRLYSRYLSRILSKNISSEIIYQAFRKAEEWSFSRKDWSLFTDLDQRKYQNAFYNHIGITNRKEINHIEYELSEKLEMKFILEEGAKRLLRELKPKFNIGLISNWDDSLFEILEELEILDFFDSIAISGDVGFSKPGPEIFKSALRDFPDVKTKESVYIGDEYLIDIVPARKLKLITVFFDKGPSGMHGHPFQQSVPGIRITSLTELPGIIQQNF
ncbi:MAG: HAD family hydrolase [Candidatus Hodarchaeales archaeon]|jgi:HAD superfamily hydrolase (TIGR01549 family)